MKTTTGELGFELLFEEIESKEIVEELDDEIDEELEEEEEDDDSEYFNTFPTKEELEYHKYLLENSWPH
ncbi:hypothetical protein Tco_0797939 [Tanacetum coccineum]